MGKESGGPRREEVGDTMGERKEGSRLLASVVSWYGVFSVTGLERLAQNDGH
jgi:hypothetical protein